MKKSKLARLGMTLVLAAALLGIAPVMQAQASAPDEGAISYVGVQPLTIPVQPVRCAGICSC